jgi:hypothetical protein
MLLSRRSKWSLFAFTALAFLLTSAAHAQAISVAAPSNSGDPFGEAKERRSRETALRSITMIGPNKRDPREQRALLEQMNYDFRQIQIIRRGMVEGIAAGKSFGYKRLAGDASEIKKRAARLRASLALRPNDGPEQPEQKPLEYDQVSIQNAASDLCLEISRFTTNPIFKPNSVYNLRLATEADITLGSIIKLSVDIKNSAEKLRRTPREH